MSLETSKSFYEMRGWLVGSNSCITYESGAEEIEKAKKEGSCFVTKIATRALSKSEELDNAKKDHKKEKIWIHLTYGIQTFFAGLLSTVLVGIPLFINLIADWDEESNRADARFYARNREISALNKD